MICKMKKSTRHIHECFVRKKTRHQVVQLHFNTKLGLNNTEIIILKEISIRILCKRKGYWFLTNKLKQKRISFHRDKWGKVILTSNQQIGSQLNSAQNAICF